MTRCTCHLYECCIAKELADDVYCGFSYKGNGGCEPSSIGFMMFLCDGSLMPSKDEHPTYKPIDCKPPTGVGCEKKIEKNAWCRQKNENENPYT